MPCCLFYCPLAFQRDPKPFKRVIVFRVSSPKKVLFLRRGNTKNDNSLKRLRIALKSERTIEKTTWHLGKSFLLKKYPNFG